MATRRTPPRRDRAGRARAKDTRGSAHGALKNSGSKDLDTGRHTAIHRSIGLGKRSVE
jgi:hypothetical protein